MYSLSKYIGGHGSALGGVVTDTGLSDWTAHPNIYPVCRKAKPEMQGIQQTRRKNLHNQGATPIVDVTYRIAVGAETIVLCTDRTYSNALALARTPAAQPKVIRIYYPGLLRHPQRARVTELFRHYDGLLSFELVDGVDCVDMFDHLRYAVCAIHLGDVRTLVIPVVPTIYREMDAEHRTSMGIADSPVRMSVDTEDEADLVANFTQAPDTAAVA